MSAQRLQMHVMRPRQSDDHRIWKQILVAPPPPHSGTGVFGVCWPAPTLLANTTAEALKTLRRPYSSAFRLCPCAAVLLPPPMSFAGRRQHHRCCITLCDALLPALERVCMVRINMLQVSQEESSLLKLHWACERASLIDDRAKDVGHRFHLVCWGCKGVTGPGWCPSLHGLEHACPRSVSPSSPFPLQPFRRPSPAQEACHS